MFSSKGFFKDVQCPGIFDCNLPNCIFSHKVNITPQIASEAPSNAVDHGDIKRRKLEDGTKVSVTGKRDVEEKSAFMGNLMATKPSTPEAPISSKANLKTATRPISPPPQKLAIESNGKAAISGSLSKPSSQMQASSSATASAKKEPKESLNPRMLPKNPAGHNVRLQLLKKLHEVMSKLNDNVSKSKDDKVKDLYLNKGELIKLALDEEEKVAKDQPTVYSNIVKQQILRYMKMSEDDWIKQRQTAKQLDEGQEKASTTPPPLETGLTPSEEVAFLSRLITSQDGLDKYGYITKPPSEADIESARKGVEAAEGWEVCDRCKSRFQVFPDRREDGALTSGGSCTYHWGKVTYVAQGPAELRSTKKQLFLCCQQELGTPGCTKSDTHVFKVSDPNRLAWVLPFQRTPYNANARIDRAICFDCEMGYTCYGLELIRLTAIAWPSGEPVLDVLVRPLGAVLDLNTRFSGVTPEQLSNAPELDVASATPEDLSGTSGLHTVSNPAAARELFFCLISSDTPVLGHALENDLNALRLVHPTIIDTVLLFPHPRGLPIRFGLRQLVKKHLNRDIQMAGAAGHDSLEDARATGDLVRWQVLQAWSKFKEEGWTVKDGQFTEPPSKTRSQVISDQAASKKRLREQEDDDALWY